MGEKRTEGGERVGVQDRDLQSNKHGEGGMAQSKCYLLIASSPQHYLYLPTGHITPHRTLLPNSLFTILFWGKYKKNYQVNYKLSNRYAHIDFWFGIVVFKRERKQERRAIGDL